jgi:hypothetical protein
MAVTQRPHLERFVAKRMGARTSEIRASHVEFISHAPEFAEPIQQAANSAVQLGITVRRYR